MEFVIIICHLTQETKQQQITEWMYGTMAVKAFSLIYEGNVWIKCKILFYQNASTKYEKKSNVIWGMRSECWTILLPSGWMPWKGRKESQTFRCRIWWWIGISIFFLLQTACTMHNTLLNAQRTQAPNKMLYIIQPNDLNKKKKILCTITKTA